MTRTCKNLKIKCVKFFGKIERLMVADLACVIAHHLKSIYQTLQCKNKHWMFRTFQMYFITFELCLLLVQLHHFRTINGQICLDYLPGSLDISF